MIRLFFLIVPCIFLGCAPNGISPHNIYSKEQFDLFDADNQRVSEETSYLIKANDQLMVKFFYEKEMDQNVIVLPDGTISLPVVNTIKAAGYTAEQLSKQISDLYKGILDQPSATVVVVNVSPLNIFVSGEVQNVGVYNPIKSISALQALTQAGGVKDTGKIKNALLIRKNKLNQPIAYNLDLSEPDNDRLLIEGDILFVPKSEVATLNLFIDQYINKNIPRFLSFSYSYAITPETRIETQ